MSLVSSASESDESNLSINWCFRTLIVPAFYELMGDDDEVREALASIVIVCGDLSDKISPHTRDMGPHIFPVVYIPWSGKAKDIICLAHEVAHALQIVFSKRAFMPPIAREVCAFIGELALINYSHNSEKKLHYAFCEVWRLENNIYLGELLERLLVFLCHPGALYSYSYNYPIARLVSIHRYAFSGSKGILDLFKSGSGAMTLLDVESVLATSTAQSFSVSKAQLSSGPAWAYTVSVFANIFSEQSNKISQLGENMVVNLARDLQLSTTIVSDRGEAAPFLLCSYKECLSDLKNIASGFGEALALTSNKLCNTEEYSSAASKAIIHCALLEGNIEGRYRSPQNGLTPIERDTLCHMMALSPSAYYEILTGQVDPFWFQLEASAGQIEIDGSVVDLAGAAPHLWFKWRSLGIHALAALKRGEANVLPKDFIFAHEVKISKPPLKNYFLNWPWVGPTRFDALTSLGLAIYHLSASRYHRQFPLSYYLPVELLPPLRCGQLRNYVSEEGKPQGLISWAWTSAATIAELHKSGRALQNKEWRAGSKLFFNDIVTEPGMLRSVMAEMQGVMFPNEKGSSLRREPDGSVRRINYWAGRNRQKFYSTSEPKNFDAQCISDHV